MDNYQQFLHDGNYVRSFLSRKSSFPCSNKIHTKKVGTLKMPIFTTIADRGVEFLAKIENAA